MEEALLTREAAAKNAIQSYLAGCEAWSKTPKADLAIQAVMKEVKVGFIAAKRHVDSFAADNPRAFPGYRPPNPKTAGVWAVLDFCLAGFWLYSSAIFIANGQWGMAVFHLLLVGLAVLFGTLQLGTLLSNRKR